jgi:hemerythrin-like domain-containing protein
MHETIRLWHHEHVNFSRLLSALDRQVGIFQRGDDPSYELMRDIVEYMRDYSDTYHHPREDVAFHRLLRHDPRLELPVNRLLQEHRVIAAAGEDLLLRLREILVGAVLPREVVAAAASTYLVYYRHHIATEEHEILPRAAQLLTDEDWSAVAAALPDVADPLFGDAPQARYAELRREIASVQAGS